ncbi:MAG: gamma-butyrobetaine hydroxylase-like domain-containing protein [Planctomycetota bacterium]|jgi:DUF971 family protein
MSDVKPLNLDLNKTEGLTVRWDDGTVSFYPIDYLRKMSPSAEMSALRQEMRDNPLTVLPPSVANMDGPLAAKDAELVGNYAIRIEFSDGHATGIYSWKYLRSIDPNQRIPGVNTDDTSTHEAPPG